MVLQIRIMLIYGNIVIKGQQFKSGFEEETYKLSLPAQNYYHSFLLI
jgi:hypothetical protein